MKLPVKVTRAAGRASLILQKHSPDILFWGGIAGVLYGTYRVAKAATKHNDLKEYNEKIIYSEKKELDTNRALPFNEKAYKQALGMVYIRAGVEWVKLYGPGVGIMTASIFSLVMGHRQSKERMASAVAAYTLIEKSYSQYRQRVIEKLGTEQDDMFRHGEPEISSYEVVDEDGKKKKIKNKVYRDTSDYTFFFDEYSVYWRNEPAMNMHYLKSQQAHFNNLLNINGHVFLNEVLDALGVPRTRAGAIVGWVKDTSKTGGDGVIDFGIYSQKNQSFVNGRSDSCLLDPNVDGVIWDLL